MLIIKLQVYIYIFQSEHNNIFGIYNEGVWGLDGVGSGQGQLAGACEYGNEISCSIKCGEFLD